MPYYVQIIAEFFLLTLYNGTNFLVRKQIFVESINTQNSSLY